MLISMCITVIMGVPVVPIAACRRGGAGVSCTVTLGLFAGSSEKKQQGKCVCDYH